MNNSICFKEFGSKCAFPEHVAPNDAVAGFGVLISFAVLSSLCLLGTYFASLRRRMVVRGTYNEWKQLTKSPRITITIGDILLVASIAISLAALIRRGKDDIIVYHHNIICNLAIAATFAALTTMVALPLCTEDRCTNYVRLFLNILSIGLLAALLLLRDAAGCSYPGRVPSENVQKDSAMVLRMSCFTKRPCPTDCKFTTDRKPMLAFSDPWALLPLGLVAFVAFARQNSVPTKWSNTHPSMWSDATMKFYNEAVDFDYMVIYISMGWVAVALWQAFSLHKWMNASGWFDDSAELAVDSFSQLVPFFQILTFLLIITATFNVASQLAKRQRNKNTQPIRPESQQSGQASFVTAVEG